MTVVGVKSSTRRSFSVSGARKVPVNMLELQAVPL